jgi:hypothetical protein
MSNGMPGINVLPLRAIADLTVPCQIDFPGSAIGNSTQTSFMFDRARLAAGAESPARNA